MLAANVHKRLLHNRVAAASAVVLALLTVFAFAGPLIWAYDYRFHASITSDSPPSLRHPFGTSRSGHDLLGQVMRGTQQSLEVAVLAGLVSAALGATWGAIAGLRGGWLDGLLMRAADVVLTVPLLVLVLVLAGSGGGAGSFEIGLLVGVFAAAGIARVVRGLTVSVCACEYVDTARALGAPEWRILAEHVLPNVMGAATVAGTLTASAAVLIEAALSFVGFGIAPPDTSLGQLVETAQDAAFTRPWLFVIPGVFLVVLCVAINLVGDGIAEALEVRR